MGVRKGYQQVDYALIGSVNTTIFQLKPKHGYYGIMTSAEAKDDTTHYCNVGSRSKVCS